jgi:hypothetical protein
MQPPTYLKYDESVKEGVTLQIFLKGEDKGEGKGDA